MTPRYRNHLTAWLGLFAMCLLVLAPLVSQWVASARAAEPAGYICSASDPQAQHGDHGDSTHGTLAACGYCDLLAGHTAAPPLPVVLPLVTLLLLFATRSWPPARFVPLGAFPSGRPRGPPVPPRFPT